MKFPQESFSEVRQGLICSDKLGSAGECSQALGLFSRSGKLLPWSQSDRASTQGVVCHHRVWGGTGAVGQRTLSLQSHVYSPAAWRLELEILCLQRLECCIFWLCTSLFTQLPSTPNLCIPYLSHTPRPGTPELATHLPILFQYKGFKLNSNIWSEF